MSALIDLPDFAAARRGLRLPVPEFYNFGFDCIDRRAREADKTACLHVDANTGVEKAFSFGDLSRASNRFANVLLGLGAKKGDFAFSMVPRIPAWYETLIGCIKTGVVGMPGTNLLQPKDIEYRLNKSRAKFAIVTAEHAAKIDAVRAKCPHLRHCIVIGAAREGWLQYEAAAAMASDKLDRAAVEATRADETMLAYFTSGTTAFPKLVPRAHSYAIGHRSTARYYHDVHAIDVH